MSYLNKYNSQFGLSKIIQDLKTRLEAVEAIGVALQNQYNTIEDVRDETDHDDGDRILCLENRKIYKYDASSTDADNGTTILKPDDVAGGDPGRWLEEVMLPTSNHTHDDKIDVPASAVTGNFPVFTSDDHIEDSGKKPSDYQETEVGKGLSSENFTTDYKNKLDALRTNQEVTDALAGKMNIISGTLMAKDVGDIITCTSEGQSNKGIRLLLQSETGIDKAGTTITLDREMPSVDYCVFVSPTNDIAINVPPEEQTITNFKAYSARNGAAANFLILTIL